MDLRGKDDARSFFVGFSALPTASSLFPLPYMLAVSMKLMPASIAVSMILAESPSSVLPPNIMHPRHSGLTLWGFLLVRKRILRISRAEKPRSSLTADARMQ
jgi:hypothetical protein